MTVNPSPRPRTGSTSPGSRTNEIHDALLLFVAHPGQLDERTDTGWLADHPSGFGAISSPSKGITYGINLTVLDTVTEHLSRADLTEVLDALADWWRYSSLRLWIGVLPIDLIVTTFEQDRPEPAAALLEVAAHRGLGRDQFFTR